MSENRNIGNWHRSYDAHTNHVEGMCQMTQTYISTQCMYMKMVQHLDEKSYCFFFFYEQCITRREQC